MHAGTTCWVGLQKFYLMRVKRQTTKLDKISYTTCPLIRMSAMSLSLPESSYDGCLMMLEMPNCWTYVSSSGEIKSMSPNRTTFGLRLSMFVQWAAVRTYSRVISDPAQFQSTAKVFHWSQPIAVMCGNSPAPTSTPFTVKCASSSPGVLRKSLYWFEHVS